MLKFFNKNNKLWKKALAVFLVGAALLILTFALINIKPIITYTNGVIGAMMAFVYGFALAFVCNPVYKLFHDKVFKFLERKKPHPRIRKFLSIIITYSIFGLVILILAGVVFQEIKSQYAELATNITSYVSQLYDFSYDFLENIGVDDPEKTINDFLTKVLEMLNITSASGENSDIMKVIIDAVIQYATQFVKSLFGHIFKFIVGFILSFYFLIFKDSIIAKVKRALCAIFKEKTYKRISHFAKYTNKTFGRYILGALCDAVLVGCVVTLVLTIFKFPYAALIGLVCGITNVIPFYGPFIGAIPSGVLVLISTVPGDSWFGAGMEEMPYKILRVAIFALIILVIQQIDGNIIAPHILGESTGLSPIAIIAVVTFCSHVFGFVGMVIGVPAAAVVAYMINCLIEHRLKKKNLPTNIEYYEVGIDVHNTDFSSVYDENEITREIPIPVPKVEVDMDDDIDTSEFDLSDTDDVDVIEIPANKAIKTSLKKKNSDK